MAWPALRGRSAKTDGAAESSAASAEAPPSGPRRTLGSWPVHPFLFAAFPAVALYAANLSEVPFRELPPIVAWSVGVSLVVWAVLSAALRDARRAGLIVSLTIALFFSARDVLGCAMTTCQWLQDLWVPRGPVHLGLAFVIVPEVVFLALFAWKISPLLARAWRPTAFLNVLAIVLIALPVARILAAPTPVRPGGSGPVEAPLFALEGPSAVQKRPDIYYIILDGYARSDVMKALFDFDNSAFLDRLEKKGFYVARGSGANYCQTPLCLSSSLNGCYLDDLVKGRLNQQTELWGLTGRNAAVPASLRNLGYRFVSFATGFETTEHPESDEYLSARGYTSEFERMLIGMTPLQAKWFSERWVDPYTLARERILYVLDHLPDVAHDPAPTFTLAHMVCPHPPFLFGENGEDVGRRDQVYQLGGIGRVRGRFPDPDEFCRAYRAQSLYLTHKVEQTIDRLLAESPEPPIIVLQSDHGSELLLDMESASHTDQRERMTILNAYYFPGRRYGALHQDITPVNSFRVVLNTYFGARLNPLPDRSYFSTWSSPFEFTDVTDRARRRETYQPEDGPPGSPLPGVAASTARRAAEAQPTNP